MIGVKCDKTRVRIAVDTGLGWIFYFDCDAPSPSYAALLRHRVAERLRNKIEAAREEAYNRGWSDAKKKRCRTMRFSGGLD